MVGEYSVDGDRSWAGERRRVTSDAWFHLINLGLTVLGFVVAYKSFSHTLAIDQKKADAAQEQRHNDNLREFQGIKQILEIKVNPMFQWWVVDRHREDDERR